MTVCIVSLHLQCPASPKKAQVVNFLDFYSALPNAAQNGDFFFLSAFKCEQPELHNWVCCYLQEKIFLPSFKAKK